MLQYDRNPSAQENVSAPRNFFLQRGKQSRSSRGDVAAQDDKLGIEHMQKAHQRSRERFEGQLQNPLRTRIAFVRRQKNSFGGGNMTGIIDH